VFNVNVPSGVLTPQGSYPSGGTTTLSVYLDPTGRILFAPNGSSGTLSAFVVDATNGSLSPVAGSPFPTGGSSVNSATAHPTKNFVYATNSNITTPTNPLPSSVAAFRFDTTTGVLTPIAGSPFSTGGTVAVLATVDPYGKFLFVTNRGTSTIQSFVIDQTTGALTSAPGSPFATEPNPTAVLLDPSGRYLYSANESGNTVSSYAIDGITGALTLVNTLPSGAAPGFFELVGLQ
jgi:6-phosphogluconolactonase